MKKIYAFAFAALLLNAFQLNAQCTVNIANTGNDTVCASSTPTLTANVVGPATTLNTTMASGNNHRGNMFDITAINTVTITSFDASPMAATTVAIYYKTGTWVGFNNNAAAWTLIGSAAVPGASLPNPVPVPVAVNVTIPAGQTYAFYVTSTDINVSLNYTDGASVGNVFSSDANIQFREGCGTEYPFSGSPFTPRVWNGAIHYAVAGTPSYLWSTSATTAAITPTVTASTAYSVEVTVAGCPTLYDTLGITVSQPLANGGTDVTACDGNTVTLNASATGNGPLQYAWDQGVMDGVPFVPPATQDYILTVTDAYSCTGMDTVNVLVAPLPVVDAGNDTTVCAGSMVTLSGSGADLYSWDGGITDGVPFTVTATMTYEVVGTTQYGCTDVDSITVMSDTLDASVIVMNETITALDTTATYQWIDCTTMQPIQGETNYWFTATTNGSYAVIISNGVCTDTSACETILSTGIAAYSTNDVVVYPNPNNGVFTVTTATVAERVVITDLAGRVIASFAPQQTQLALSLEGQANGVYFVVVTNADRTNTTVKVVKQ